MKTYLSLFVALLTLAATLAPKAVAQAPEYEISKFRYAEHRPLGFERLVIEFRQKQEYRYPPQVKSIMNASGSEIEIFLQNFAFVGGIPEVAINESYSNQSRYLGPVSINMDDSTTGASIRAFLKSKLLVDAFWLTKPSRLVIDVYPRTSQRVQGRHVTRYAKRSPKKQRRGLASVNKKKDGFLSDNSIVCFPANAQVVPKIAFHMKDGSFDPTQNVQWTPVNPTAMKKSVCFPRTTEVIASIGFDQYGNNRSPRGMIPRRPMSQAPPQLFTNPAPKMAAPSMSRIRRPLQQRSLASPGPAPFTGGSLPGGIGQPSKRFPTTRNQSFQRTRPGGGRLDKRSSANYIGAQLKPPGAN